MSRFSPLSYLPQKVTQGLTRPPPPPNAAKRPRVAEVWRKHPRNLIYAGVLCSAAIGMGIGLGVAIARRRRGRNRGGPADSPFFVIALVIIILLALRQLLFVFRLFRPVAPAQQKSTIPSWVFGRPPTYDEALYDTSGSRSAGNVEGGYASTAGGGVQGRGTGDVEDRAIGRNEGLPKYGETGGSTLLASGQAPVAGAGHADADIGVIERNIGDGRGTAARPVGQLDAERRFSKDTV